MMCLVRKLNASLPLFAIWTTRTRSPQKHEPKLGAMSRVTISSLHSLCSCSSPKASLIFHTPYRMRVLFLTKYVTCCGATHATAFPSFTVFGCSCICLCLRSV